VIERREKEKDPAYIQRIWEETFFTVLCYPLLATRHSDIQLFSIKIEKLDCVLSKRATRPYIYDHTSANAYVRIYV
jgi:hypothetical protein